MKWLKKEWLQWLILGAPFCAAALAWDKLPARMPIHWNLSGEVDGYAGKIFALGFLPTVNIFAAVLIAFLPRLDPKIRSYDEETRASLVRVARTLRLSLTAFIAAIGLGVIATGLQWPVKMSLVINFGVAALFVVMGNCMGKLRPNYFMGYRMPWTLNSREVWMKTHRLAGGLMVAGGLILLVLGFVVPVKYYFLCAMMPLLVLMVAIPAVYSYWVYKGGDRA